MHVLYVHQNYPAQFGHVAAHLVKQLKWQATFVTLASAGGDSGIQTLQYQTTGGPTRDTHFCSRTFESNTWHGDGVYRALRDRPFIRPDLIVAHAGLGSAHFLRELYPDVPVLGFFEYYYRPHHPQCDMGFRADLGWKVEDIRYLRARNRNAISLLELQNCQLGYAPTAFQLSTLPKEYHPKLRVLFDGIERRIFHGHNDTLRPVRSGPRKVGGVAIPDGARVVTYCSRGFESMRGFDIFMKAAKLICRQRNDVIFLVVGSDRMVYGGDEQHLAGKTFKQWVLEQDSYDLDRIRFLGQVPPSDLAKILAASDLHLYLTAPFVLSWSMINAMSCGAVVLGSRTPPVEEMITDGSTGLLADFHSPEEFADKALKVLADPQAYRPLGRAAEEKVASRLSTDVILPQMVQLYEATVQTKTGLESPRPLAPSSPRQVLAPR